MQTARFVFGYVAFIAPLVVLLGLEFDDCAARGITPGQASVVHATLDLNFIAACVAWIATVAACYVILLLSQCDKNKRGPEQRSEDWIKLLYFSVVLGAVGGVAGRVWSTPWFVAVVGAFLALYTWLFESVRERRITISPQMLMGDHWKFGIAVVLFATVVSLLALSSQLITAFRVSQEFFFAYLALVLLVGGAHVALLCFNKNFHVHHWYWSLILAHACVFDTTVSMLAQAMLLAVHIHGVACFGYEPVFPALAKQDEL